VLVLKDKTVLTLAGIAAITILEAINMIYFKVDGAVLSGAVGAIVFLITRKVYRG